VTAFAVRAVGLGKCYQLDRAATDAPYATLRESIVNAVRMRGARNKHRREALWALRDVSFEVEHGEVLGIIGRNGAGKSTLLKLLSRISEPTAGYADVSGRVGSLLEVGTGFHPELTGRENIFLNGQILGMSKADIRRRFDEIVAFAELEPFLDTPVKRYSSGMYMRLAFSVAAHLEPEVLVVDEVLAVGDAEFQKKCLGKMQEVAGAGRTVLLVSHNTGVISQLCERALWLDHGVLQEVDSAASVVRLYLASGAAAGGHIAWLDDAAAPGDVRIRLLAVRLCNVDGIATDRPDMSEPLVVEIQYRVIVPARGIRLGFRIVTSDGVIVCSGLDWEQSDWKNGSRLPGVYVSRCHIPALLLNRTSYSLTVAADIPYQETLFFQEGVLRFDMIDTLGVTGPWPSPAPGVIHGAFGWESTRLAVDSELVNAGSE
jgi:lipopolysaccharide transport system ATP-binding protein